MPKSPNPDSIDDMNCGSSVAEGVEKGMDGEEEGGRREVEAEEGGRKGTGRERRENTDYRVRINDMFQDPFLLPFIQTNLLKNFLGI